MRTVAIFSSLAIVLLTACVDDTASEPVIVPQIEEEGLVEASPLLAESAGFAGGQGWTPTCEEYGGPDGWPCRYVAEEPCGYEFWMLTDQCRSGIGLFVGITRYLACFNPDRPGDYVPAKDHGRALVECR